MPYAANVLNVMIASPGDCTNERKALTETILNLSIDRSEQSGIVFMPRLWEVDAIPGRGSPQGLIDEQIAERADILVALFRTHLGTVDDDGASGTMHEIELCTKREIPVHVYFYSGPVDATVVDRQKWAKLGDYQKTLSKQALYGDYSEIPILQQKVVKALLDDQQKIADSGALPTLLTDEQLEQVRVTARQQTLAMQMWAPRAPRGR